VAVSPGASSRPVLQHACARADPPLLLAAERGGRAALPMHPTTSSVVSVFSVLLSTFLNLLGFTMTIPINVALRDHFALGMGASFGSLSSAYPLGQFGALFLWPRLSDRVGRRPVMALSLGGTGLGLALQALAVARGWSVATFLGCRFLTGCCAGASPVGKALLADIGAATGQLPRFMAWRDAATTLAFIAGPWFGGWLYSASGSLSTVIGATAAGSIAAGVGVALCTREPTHAVRTKGASATDASPSPPPEEKLIACPLGRDLITAIATVCCVSSLYNCGSATFSAFFGPLAQDLCGVGVQQIGFAHTLLASVSFATSTLFAAQAQRALGTVFTCALGLGIVATSLLAMGAVARLAPLAHGGVLTFWAAAAFYQVGVPLYAPTVPTMLLQCVPRQQRGTVMGLDEAINTIARVSAPLVFGGLYASRGAFACFAAAATAVSAAAAVAIIRRFVVLRGNYE